MHDTREILVHIGFHKTGSTSIQLFLEAMRSRLQALDVDVFSGCFIPSNHVELHVAAMRDERMSGFKLAQGLRPDAAFRDEVAARVEAFGSSSPCRRLVFTAEGLSLLRYPDEMERLRALLPPGRITILAYLRDVASFKESYAHELRNHRLPDLVDRDSFAYLGEGSWVLDFPERLDRFRDAFGPDRVVTIDFDAQVRQYGSVIPSLLRQLGVEAAFTREDWQGFQANRRTPAPT